MTAMSQARSIAEKEGVHTTAPVKAATTVLQGALTVMASGWATPGATATGLVPIGVAVETVENAGANGAKNVTAKRGTFKFFNQADDAITAAEIGKDCYIVDDQTVAKTSDTDARSIAGKVTDVDDDGVWVRVGY